MTLAFKQQCQVGSACDFQREKEVNIPSGRWLVAKTLLESYMED